MERKDAAYVWEDLPEYRSTQQLARVIGRLLPSLPRRLRRTIGRGLIQAPLVLAAGIVGANAELPAGAGLTADEQAEFRGRAREACDLLRDMLRLLRDERIGSQPDLLVALELLDRIDERIAARERRP